MPLPSKPPLTMGVAQISFKERLRLAIEAAAAKLPKAVGAQLLQLLDPTALATMAVVTAIWAGLQFTGAGEVADVALLVVGWTAVGGAAWQGGRELIEFAVGVEQAKTRRISIRPVHISQQPSACSVCRPCWACYCTPRRSLTVRQATSTLNFGRGGGISAQPPAHQAADGHTNRP